MKKTSLIFLILMGVILSGCQDPPVEETQTAAIEEEIWDLLWVTDSSGWGVAEKYGKFIAIDNDVEVNVLDKWKGGLAAGRLLNALKGGQEFDYDLSRIRELVSEAEVIVIYGNPEMSKVEGDPWDWNCGQGVSACYVNNCGMESFNLYIDHLKEIYSIIFELRKGKPTIIRAIDAYNPRLANQCAEDGVMDECVACWENYNRAIHQAADEMGVPVANVFDEWNGPDHTDDPVLKGYTQADNEHPNEKGAGATAAVLRDLGYEPIVP